MSKIKNQKKDSKINNEAKKKNKEYSILKKRAKVIGIVCLVIIVLEIIIMFVMNQVKESKITYLDTIYNIENIDDEYYLAAGSSNFKHSQYNNAFTYQYEDGMIKDQINTVYALQAKLIKYDKELNVVFEETFKTEYDSTFYHAIKVKDGYIAVGSYVYEKKQLSLNTRDALIVKYDFDGNFLWSKNYQVLGDTEFKKVLLVEDGLIVVGQSIYENMEIGNHDKGGGIIVKYDFDGNVIWKNNFGGNKSGIFEDVVRLEDGYIVCGKDAANYGMLVKYDFEGNHVWTKNYSNTDTYGMTDIKLHENKLYIAGAYNISDEKDEEGNTLFKYDACIFVYDLDGELLDKYTIGGSGDDRFNSLMIIDDKIIAVGYTKSSDIDIKNIPYTKDLGTGIIIEFSLDGKLLKSDYYGGMNNDILTDITNAILEESDTINETRPFVVVGYCNSRIGLFNGNNKDYYSHILKYSKIGELLNEK